MPPPAQPTRVLVESNGRHTATFRFPAHWDAWKYDEEGNGANGFFQGQVKGASGVSAVDFVAHDAGCDALLLIECKDIRGATDENRPRLSLALSKDEFEARRLIKSAGLSATVARRKPYLPHEFAKNLRETLVGLMAAARAGDPALGALAGLVLGGRKLVCVLSFEMDPLPDWQPGEGARLLSRLKTAIEREVAFLQNVEVVICSGLHATPPHAYQWQIQVSP